MSTNNSFYRYKIDELSDINESAFARRLLKASQNNKKSFFFEINKSFDLSQTVPAFILNKIKNQDCILTSINNHFMFSNHVKPEQLCLNINAPSDLVQLVNNLNGYFKNVQNLLFKPSTISDLKYFVEFKKNNSEKYQIFWGFVPYNKDLLNSLTIRDINKYNLNYATIKGLEIFNTKIPKHYELEPTTDVSYKINWNFSLVNSQPKISVIIPTYNNAQFLCNVIWHLINQSSPKEMFEIIIADDGSQDKSSEIIHSLYEKFKYKINLKYIYWSKNHPIRGEQLFFRPGLARNLGTRYSSGKYLLFLDSDMIVPEDFISTCLTSLQSHDIIQFQRFHISQDLSKINPTYKSVDLKKDTYIEEKNYWSDLFFCNKWSELPDYWKYTCTYTLGVSKENFFKLGMFKKYYISYGFEDTDIGYEAFKQNFKFNLIKIPILHLTAYDMMQYRNSASKRFKLLRTTAELFYLQHLDKEIFNLLGNYYRAQKPIKAFFRDLIS